MLAREDRPDMIPRRDVVGRGMNFSTQTWPVHFPAPLEEDLPVGGFDRKGLAPDPVVVGTGRDRPGIRPRPGQQQRAALTEKRKVTAIRERLVPHEVDVHDVESPPDLTLQPPKCRDVGSLRVERGPDPRAEVRSVGWWRRGLGAQLAAGSSLPDMDRCGIATDRENEHDGDNRRHGEQEAMGQARAELGRHPQVIDTSSRVPLYQSPPGYAPIIALLLLEMDPTTPVVVVTALPSITS